MEENEAAKVLKEDEVRQVVQDSLKTLQSFGEAVYSKANADQVEICTRQNGWEKQRSGESESSSVLATDNSFHGGHITPAESSYLFFFQVLFPFLVAGLGMVLAGLLLDVVQHWPLFNQVPEIFILVPSLLGLKGNLEMTLASRLSTLANLGKMDSRREKTNVIMANLALVQAQAIVVALLASGFAIVLAWIPKGQVDWSHAALLCASSLTTASLASFVLGIIMVCVVIGARSLSINPDNVATPIAASLGDITTLCVLSAFGSFFLRAHQTESWLNLIVICVFVLMAPVWMVFAARDPITRRVLADGWSPVIFSMLISSAGGFVLEISIKRFPPLALYQPVINGVGGNLVAVQASRISTYFHRSSVLGILPNQWTYRHFLSFSRAFFSKDWDSRGARVLLLLVVPGHILFTWLISLVHNGAAQSHSATFISFYLIAALTQVVVLLYVCQLIVAVMFSMEVDPDNAAIPYLTALGDLLGTVLLFVAFLLYALIIGDKTTTGVP